MRALWQVLANQAVGVLVRAALPRAVWIAEEDAHPIDGDGDYDSDVFDLPLAQPDVVRSNKRGPSEELVVVERRVSRRLS